MLGRTALWQSEDTSHHSLLHSLVLSYIIKGVISTSTDRIENPATSLLPNTVTYLGNIRQRGHVDPASDLGSSKVIPMVLSLAQGRSAEQLGNSDSWEPSQSPADPRCSSLPLSLQLFPFFLFSFTISISLPSVEKTGKAAFQFWNGCFRQLLLSPSPLYPRCSQSCVKMSELCKLY